MFRENNSGSGSQEQCHQGCSFPVVLPHAELFCPHLSIPRKVFVYTGTVAFSSAYCDIGCLKLGSRFTCKRAEFSERV